MNLIEHDSHLESVNQSLANKLICNTYRVIGSKSGRAYRREYERAQKKLAKKLALLPDYLK